MTSPVGRPRLRLLDEVAWDDERVAGERSRRLLARLALAGGRAVADDTLVAALWPDARPASPGKALQVVVSRTRGHTGAEVVARAGEGYRLALTEPDVDVFLLDALVRDAVAAEAGHDAVAARDLARAALALPAPPTAPDTAPAAEEVGDDPVAELRRAAATQRRRARLVLGRSASALDDHTTALEHLDEPGTSEGPGGPERTDEATLVALLRSEAAVSGAGAALERFERYRRDLAETTGSDPGPELQRVQAELLARDRPDRHGLRHDASSLVGRDDDVAAVSALLRSVRVVSIVGPGGLGKTRLAQVVSAASDVPVVRFVELVGVTNPDDVVVEVGSALDVRDSVGGRRVLSAEQRNDVRARIAQQVDRAPTLLVLDNCEHVVEAVADLVAYLVAVASQVRVLTTTRAPLAIPAEHVLALARLDDDDAARLFRERARAARPAVTLDPQAVARVVARLDGLPLAVELAAARVRAMSVDDVARRLDDRFALLRGGDRSAPDRHRTLLAVIEWSWDLLSPPEQRALARLSVFADGFALEAAERVLDDPDALTHLETLADQSLLTVVEPAPGARGARSTRYRMLETVREFGRLRLRATGEEDDALRAAAGWARALARRAAARLQSVDQVAAVDEVSAEEGNLVDVLHRSLSVGDPVATVELVAALGGCWTIRGEHQRVAVLADAVDAVLDGWLPPDDGGEDEDGAGTDLVDLAAAAALSVVTNVVVADQSAPDRARALLHALAPRVRWPAIRAAAVVVSEFDFADPAGMVEQLSPYWDSEDRLVAGLALQWSSHALENGGDQPGAVDVAERALALWRPDDGPWTRAILLTQLAGLRAQQGEDGEATRFAGEALPLLERLGAADDAVQLKAIMAFSAMTSDRLDEAERLVDALLRDDRDGWGMGASITVGPACAELDLARGRTVEGLARYRAAVADLRAMRFPGLTSDDDPARPGAAPWVVFGTAAAVMAHAGAGARHHAEAVDLRDDLVARAPAVLDAGRRGLDFPVAGLLLVAVGGWELARPGDPDESRATAAVRLLALAHRFGYNRFTPSLSWARMAALAEARLPGRVDVELADVQARPAPDLLPEARDLVARLSSEMP